MTRRRFIPLDEFLLSTLLLDVPAEVAATCNTSSYRQIVTQTPGLSYAMIGRGMVLAAGGAILRPGEETLGWLLFANRATRADRAIVLRFSSRRLDELMATKQLQEMDTFIRTGAPFRAAQTRALDMREIEGQPPEGLAGHVRFRRVVH